MLNSKMTKLKVLLGALIGTVMAATPAMARTSHVTHSWPLAEDAKTNALPMEHYADGRVHIPAPRVVATPPAVREGNECDIGDTAYIC
jgi:hypothetical protein